MIRSRKQKIPSKRHLILDTLLLRSGLNMVVCGEEMQNKVFFDIFQNIMERMKGKQNHQLGERAMDLLMMIYSVSPKASWILSANIHGPCVPLLRLQKKKANVTSLGNGTEVPIICRTIIENATHNIVEHHIMYCKSLLLFDPLYPISKSSYHIISTVLN